MRRFYYACTVKVKYLTIQGKVIYCKGKSIDTLTARPAALETIIAGNGKVQAQAYTNGIQARYLRYKRVWCKDRETQAE